MGVGEAPLFPGGARVVRDWFGVRERGFATGLLQSASSLGNFIAVPLTYLPHAEIELAMDVSASSARRGYCSRLRGGAFTAIRRMFALPRPNVAYLTEGDENTSSKPPSFAEWKRLFAHRTTWGMIAGFFGTVYALWVYTGWLPYYLEHERHMSVARVGIVGAIPYFFGCAGAVAGGWLCDFLTQARLDANG